MDSDLGNILAKAALKGQKSDRSNCFILEENIDRIYRMKVLVEIQIWS